MTSSNITRFCSTVVLALLMTTPMMCLSDTNLRSTILDNLIIEDPDVRKDALIAVKRKFELSDDDFSLLLMMMAEDFKTNGNSVARGFTIGALLSFGTTNALDFVRNEAINGPSYAEGLDCYGIITEFDDRYFKLVDEVVANVDSPFFKRKWEIYLTMEQVIHSNGHYFRSPPSEYSKEKCLSYLHNWVNAETNSAKSLDRLMQRVDSNYANSAKRMKIIRNFATTLPESSPMYGYFQAELAALTNSAQTVGTVVDGAPVAGKDDELDDAGQKYGRGWIAIAGGAVAVLVIAGLVVRRRRGGE